MSNPILIQDILAILFGILFMLVSIIIPKKLQQRNLISKYLARKLIHSLGGLVILVTPFLSIYALGIGVILFWIFTILILLSKPDSKVKLFRDIFNAVSESDEIQYGRLQGPFLYALSIAIIFGIFAFFRQSLYFPIAGGLVMMYADTMASLVGKKYGKHKIKLRWNQNARSLEGSITFLIIALIICFIIFSVFGIGLSSALLLNPLNFENLVLFSILFSIITTLLELFSPSKYDDLILCIGGTLIIFLISIVV